MKAGEIALMIFTVGALLLFFGWMIAGAYLNAKLWRVKYPASGRFKGGYSTRMSWFDARNYANIFGAKIVKHGDLEAPFAWYCAECAQNEQSPVWHEITDPNANINGYVFCPSEKNQGQVVFDTRKIHIKPIW